MDTNIQPSFIPHDTAVGAASRGSRGGLYDLLTLVSIVLLVASLALAAGVFLYQQFLQSSSKSKLVQLERAKQAFEPSLIQQLTRLDDRMRSANQVLGTHIAPSVFFHTLEQVTLVSVAFQTLDFEAVDPQNMSIKMDGVANSVNGIALQADLFSKNGVVTDPIFSNINRAPDGVHFSMTAIINPGAVRYVQMISAAEPPPAPAPQSGAQNSGNGGGAASPFEAPPGQSGGQGGRQGPGQAAPQSGASD